MGKQNTTIGNQLNIQFESSNLFATQLRSGKFTIVVECLPPATGQPFDSGIAMARNLAAHINGIDQVTAMAIADRIPSEDRYEAIRVAEQLRSVTEKPVIMHLSGRGRSPGDAGAQLSQAAAAGINNILAVTGDRSEKHPRPHHLKRNPEYAAGYLDSVDIIRQGRANSHNFHLGAGVNPYKYNPADQYLQFYKMVRKLATGAEFLVTNFGWDMKKLQELQWYLQMRDIGVPVLARIGLLNPARIAELSDTVVPGVPISRAFAALLQRESNINATQSLAAQMQRLALQIAGCRHLGYSGVQLTGIREPKTLDMVLKKAAHLAEELNNYSDWATAWNSHHSELDFAPSHASYYVFQGLLNPGQQMYNENKCQQTEREFPSPVLTDRLRSATIGLLFSKKSPDVIRDLALKLWCRSCIGKACDLRYSYSLCPKPCPKRLVYGACGGSLADGTCEFGHQTCFFHRVLALASTRHNFDRLEEAVPND